MTYEQVKSLKPEDFKRLCGVCPETFNQMLKIVRSQKETKQKTGRPGKLSMEDQLLMTLEYWREYRTCLLLIEIAEKDLVCGLI